jgi:hypothetical protein
MAKFRVLAELTQLYEIELEADSASLAVEMAKGLDSYEFSVWDDTGLSDGFDIINAEEIE